MEARNALHTFPALLARAETEEERARIRFVAHENMSGLATHDAGLAAAVLAVIEGGRG